MHLMRIKGSSALFSMIQLCASPRVQAVTVISVIRPLTLFRFEQYSANPTTITKSIAIHTKYYRTKFVGWLVVGDMS